jgi:hypothetical protein
MFGFAEADALVMMAGVVVAFVMISLGARLIKSTTNFWWYCASVIGVVLLAVLQALDI